MTSRRSRLKAVTNLPVRRKVPTVQGNTNDNTVDSLTPEKSLSCHLKPDDISSTVFNSNQDQVEGTNLYDTPNGEKGNDSNAKSNSVPERNENLQEKNDISKNTEPDNLELLESSNDISKTCNLLSCKADNSSVFNSDQNCKLNSVSSPSVEKVQVQAIENENEILLQESCIINFSDSNKNNNLNNNIVEDGSKCYTVLTPQGVALDSLTEYTIAPLVSCANDYMETSVGDVGVPQEFDEVQIYTEVEPTELFNNDINDNSESIIETEPLEPVLTTLTNFNSENEINCMNSEVVELTNSENLVAKPVKRVSYGRASFRENEQQKSSTQNKKSNILERTVSSGSIKVTPDFHTFKQISAIRRKKVKYNDCAKKLADAKREFQRKYVKSKPDRSSLKMIDLIFYNPTSNPMESKTKFEKKDTLDTSSSDLVNDLLMEEKVDEPDMLDSNSRSNLSDNGESENGSKMPVPQVKIGLDGEIILDEKSLVIETTEAKKGREGLQNSIPILEDKGYKVSYYRGRSKKTRDWADFETKRFYKALNTIGPDFTLMQNYFPKRSRLELKNKFKREERLNRALIDKALNNPSEFDMTQLEKDLAVEKEAEEGIEMRFCRIVKQTTKRPRIRSSFLSREMIESDDDEESEKSQTKPFDLDSKRLSEKEKNKKEKEFNFVFHKLLQKESEKSGALLTEIPSSPNTLKSTDHDVT